jgi:hypothetical protein
MSLQDCKVGALSHRSRLVLGLPRDRSPDRRAGSAQTRPPPNREAVLFAGA